MDVESEQAAAGRTPLIDSLVADLVPVRPVRLARMYVLTLCAQLLFVATAALFVGASSPALAKTSAVFFGALVALLAAGAFAAAAAATKIEKTNERTNEPTNNNADHRPRRNPPSGS